MECEFPGRISAAEIYFVIKKVKNFGGKGYIWLFILPSCLL